MAWDRRIVVAIAGGAVVLLFLALLVGFTFSEQRAGVGPAAEGARPAATVQEEQAARQESRPAEAEAPLARLTLPRDPARQEGELQFSAEGFMPGETVTVGASEGQSGPTTAFAEAKADAQGRLQDTAVELPEWLLSGPHAVTVKGNLSGRVAEGTLYVRAKEAWIELGDYATRQAGQIGLVAGGFEAEEEVRLYVAPGQDRPGQLPAEPLASMVADRAGNTDWSEVRLPLLNPGQYALVLQGASSEVEVVRVIEVQPLIPLLGLNPWSGPPGTGIAVDGQGFKPGEKVRVLFEGSNEPVATLTADAYGNVWSDDPIAVPQRLGGGTVSVMLEGEESGARAAERFSVVGGRDAWSELSSYAGPPGSTVYFGGGGFGSGETVNVHVGDRGGPIVASGQTESDGRLSQVGPATVPADRGEEITYTIVGASSGAEASAKYKVLRPLGPNEGAPGDGATSP